MIFHLELVSLLLTHSDIAGLLLKSWVRLAMSSHACPYLFLLMEMEKNNTYAISLLHKYLGIFKNVSLLSVPLKVPFFFCVHWRAKNHDDSYLATACKKEK